MRYIAGRPECCLDRCNPGCRYNCENSGPAPEKLGTFSGCFEPSGRRYNCENGGPAPEKLTNAIFANTGKLSQYYIAAEELAVDLSKPGSARFLVQHHATAKFGEFVVQARPALLPTERLAEAFEVHGVPRTPLNPVLSALYGAHNIIMKAGQFVIRVRFACLML